MYGDRKVYKQSCPYTMCNSEIGMREKYFVSNAYLPIYILSVVTSLKEGFTD